MKSPCEIVAERVALGEPLGELSEHAASCAGCRALAALPVELAGSRRETEPGAGFSARIAAGAQRRLNQRRRRRIALASGAIVMTAAASFALVVRPACGSQDDPLVEDTASNAPAARPIDVQPVSSAEQDSDLRTLVQFARYERASHASARWSHVLKTLAPYRTVVAGVRP